jgi:type VI secretion system secreted protein Hcp
MKHVTQWVRKTLPVLAASAILVGVLGISSLGSRNTVEAAPATGNADYFLKIDGIAGDSTDAQHVGEIELNSVDWSNNGTPGLEQSGTTAGSGGGAGKVKLNDIHFTQNVSKASPKLMLSTANGQHYKEAILSVRKAGKTKTQFLTFKMTDVLVSSYRFTGKDQSLPTDEFSLDFAKIEQSFTPQKADGSADTPVTGGFDFKANTENSEL